MLLLLRNFKNAFPTFGFFSYFKFMTCIIIFVCPLLILLNEINSKETRFTFFQKTDADKARKLLDVLPSRGPKAFSYFLDSLREEYEWLAEELESVDVLDGSDLIKQQDVRTIYRKTFSLVLQYILKFIFLARRSFKITVDERRRSTSAVAQY